MNEQEVLELYKTKEGRKDLVFRIMQSDNFSITEIVHLKEQIMRDKNSELNETLSRLSIRATCIFMGEKELERIKPLIAESLIETRICEGTPFEKELLEIIGKKS